MDWEKEAKRERAERGKAIMERDALAKELGRLRASAAVTDELRALGVPAVAVQSIATLALLDEGLTFEADGTILRGTTLPSAKSIASAAVKAHAAIVENARAFEGGSAGTKRGTGAQSSDSAGAWDPEELRAMERDGLEAVAAAAKRDANVLDAKDR